MPRPIGGYLFMVMHLDLVRIEFLAGDKHPPAGVVGKFGDGLQAEVWPSSSDDDSKRQGVSQSNRVVSKRNLKENEGYFGTEIVILNRSQMTQTAPEPESLFLTHTTPAGGHFTLDAMFNVLQAHARRIFGVGNGFRPWSPQFLKQIL
ncbi:hypothetical protein AVEN_197218-1 [Araneus ventricosus]|uniref:Uncharacterized protein n=1 Tax=Araneus ventricosus TaxID=182803 RepID=A0A4Y2GGD8_ARAVE|nr:hypothetical protein AVEN_197218-1 [Araneus ventricosus]